MNIHEIDEINFSILRQGVTDHIEASADLYDDESILVLDVAPQDWAGAKRFYKKATIQTLDIDPSSNANYIADITKNNSNVIPDEHFDIIVLTEVLEHTLNPFDAVSEILRILKPGGKLVMTTPFNFRIHGPLPDCWRFSVHGLNALLNSFSKVDIEENGTDRFLFPVQYKTIAIK
jgi:SAM-dependent methyltransferase